MIGQLLQIPFGGGVDEFTAEKWLEPGKQQKSVTNGVFTKNGLIDKRRGFSALPMTKIAGSTGTISSVAKLVEYKGELLAIDGDAMYSYSPGSPVPGWVRKNLVPACAGTRRSVSPGGKGAIGGDCAEGSGVRAFVWWNGSSTALGDVFVTLLDTSTGTALYESYQLTLGATFYNPKVVILNGVVAVVYGDGSGKIYAQTLTLANLASSGWGAATLLLSDATVRGPHDVVPIVGDTNFIIAYVRAAGGPGWIKLAKFSMSLAAGTTATLGDAVDVALASLAVRADLTANVVWLAWSMLNGGQYYTRYALRTTALVATLAPTTLYTDAGGDNFAHAIGVEKVSATRMCVVWSSPHTSTDGQTFWQQVNTDGSLTGPKQTGYHLGIVSKPFLYGGRVYALCQSPTSLTIGLVASFFLCDFEVQDISAGARPRAVATVSPRTANNIYLMQFGAMAGTVPNALSNVSGIGDAAAKKFCSAVQAGAFGDVTGRQVVQQCMFDFGHKARWLSTELGENTNISAGVPLFYDGQTVGEIGYAYGPLILFNATNAAGGSMAAGAYQYTVVYEWVDATGTIHRSAPCTPVTISPAGGAPTNKVTLTISTYTLTTRHDSGQSVKIVVYRTTASGTVFYRTTTLDGAHLNLLTAPSITFDDTIADADLVGTALQPAVFLYVTGGVLDNVCPPSSMATVVHRGRLWMVGDDGKTIWYTKRYTAGEAPAFNEAMTFTVDDGGDVTALASLDDKLVIFKADRLFIVYGDGPGDTGAGSDLTAPQRLSADVGCDEPRSIVVTSAGIMFAASSASGANAGIYLLSRDGSVKYAGKPMADTFAAYPVCKGASISPAQNLVRFVMVDAETSTAGVVVMYDYVQDGWAKHTYAPAAMLGCAVWGGAFALATSTGVVWLERASTSSAPWFDPGNAWVTTTVETAWFKPSGVLGFKRARSVTALLNHYGDHNLTLDVGYDYASSYAQTKTWTSLTVAERMQLDMGDGLGGCTAIRFRMSDAAPTGGGTNFDGHGSAFVGLALEWIQKTKAGRLADAQRS